MRFMRVVVDVELRIDALRSFTTLLAKDIREEYIMMVEDECGRIDISISDDDDDDLVDDDDCYDVDDNDDDDSGGKCHDRDERDIILDDDDNNDMKHRSISSCRSILGEKRRKTRRTSSSHVPHDVEKHLQSIITETKRKGTELEGTELLSSMMVDRGSRGSHGCDSHAEGGNPRSVASKRAKMIFGSSLQSKSIINTIAKPQSHLPIKMEHKNNKSSNNNSSSSSNKSTVNSITKSTSTTLKPTSLLDIDRLASSAIDPPSKSSSQASSSMQANRFKCGVCTERPSLPCAGRCGHICCQACWVKWLQINATCPMCRAPADKNSVTRLIMKA